MKKDTYSIGECDRLSETNSEWLIKLLLLESTTPVQKKIIKQEQLKELEKDSFLGAIIAQRVLAIDAKVTLPVILFGALVCDRPGAAVIYLIDILNILGKGDDEHPITLSEVCMNVYPNGFRTEKSLMNVIDSIKSKGKEHSEFAFLY